MKLKFLVVFLVVLLLIEFVRSEETVESKKEQGVQTNCKTEAIAKKTKPDFSKLDMHPDPLLQDFNSVDDHVAGKRKLL
eukprot:gene7354-11676_t